MSKDVVVIEEFEEWNDWYANGEIFLEDIDPVEVHPNSGVVLKGGGCKEHGLVVKDKIVRVKHYVPCGITSKNSEQTLALAMLREKGIPLKIISGVAGSGKTLLACAHALHRLNDPKDSICKIIITKSMTPVGRDIGFLKGSIEEKTKPWMGNFLDNFLNCGYSGMDVESMVQHEQLEIMPIAHVQGRSISNAIIIVDEIQNLDIKTIKQLITRAAEGSEIILLGDQSQQFEIKNNDRSIDVLLEKGKSSNLVATIHLRKSIRSAISEWAVNNL